MCLKVFNKLELFWNLLLYSFCVCCNWNAVYNLFFNLSKNWKQSNPMQLKMWPQLNSIIYLPYAACLTGKLPKPAIDKKIKLCIAYATCQWGREQKTGIGKGKGKGRGCVLCAFSCAACVRQTNWFWFIYWRLRMFPIFAASRLAPPRPDMAPLMVATGCSGLALA